MHPVTARSETRSRPSGARQDHPWGAGICFTVYVGEERLSLQAGSFAFGPRGVPHTFIAETHGAKALIGFQPFLFEGFLHEVGEPATERVLPPPLTAPPDMARIIPIGKRNG